MIALDIQVCYDRVINDATTSITTPYDFWINVGGEKMFGPVQRTVTVGDSLTAHAAAAFQEMIQA